MARAAPDPSAASVLTPAHHFEYVFVSSFHQEIYLKLEYTFILVSSTTAIMTPSSTRASLPRGLRHLLCFKVETDHTAVMILPVKVSLD